MYARFSDQARKVMQLANQEAQRFNQEYIGTEHILLGIVQAGDSSAATILTQRGVELGQVRQEVEKIVQSGPGMVTMGKLPQTPRAKKVLECAVEEARNLGHKHVGTEHLLSGLLRVEEGVAAQVLQSLGVQLAEVREAVLALYEGEPARTTPVSSTPPAPGESVAFVVTLSSKAIENFQKLRELSGRETLEGVLTAALRLYLPADAALTVRCVPPDSAQNPS